MILSIDLKKKLNGGGGCLRDNFVCRRDGDGVRDLFLVNLLREFDKFQFSGGGSPPPLIAWINVILLHSEKKNKKIK